MDRYVIAGGVTIRMAAPEAFWRVHDVREAAGHGSARAVSEVWHRQEKIRIVLSMARMRIKVRADRVSGPSIRLFQSMLSPVPGFPSTPSELAGTGRRRSQSNGRG